jgi:dienelactone hydrolase
VLLGDGGAELPAAVYRPREAGLRPGVIVAPGGLARGSLEGYAWAGERLAADGFTALVVTYRAASPDGDVDDLALALDRLQGDADVDQERLAILGHSRGGMAALRAAVVDARVRAVVSIAAPVDIAQYVRSVADFAPSARDGVVQFMGGTPEEVPERYERVRAVSLAERIRQPVLLVHGAADMRVPPSSRLGWSAPCARPATNASTWRSSRAWATSWSWPRWAISSTASPTWRAPGSPRCWPERHLAPDRSGAEPASKLLTRQPGRSLHAAVRSGT